MLTKDDFTIGTTTYTIDTHRARPGPGYRSSSTAALTNARERTHSLEFTKGTSTRTLKFSAAAQTGNLYRWTIAGFSWAAGDTVTVKVLSDPPDTTPPAPGAASVDADGLHIGVTFDEDLDQTDRARAGDFAVTADGEDVEVTGVAGAGTGLRLTVSRVIRQGRVGDR